MADSFRQAYRVIGIPYGLPAELLDIFAAWYELLIKWNRKINLTKITGPSEVVIYHLADSLPLSRLLQPDCTLLDIGSGSCRNGWHPTLYYYNNSLEFPCYFCLVFLPLLINKAMPPIATIKTVRIAPL